MTSWIVTQTDRFKACVPIAAVTDWHSFYFTTNIQKFFYSHVGESPYQMQEKALWFHRSPVFAANKTRTPTLQMVGDVDHCVDKSQGKEFHTALLDNGVPSVLVRYPNEGHGIRKFPAVIDYNVRFVGWFEHYMPSDPVQT